MLLLRSGKGLSTERISAAWAELFPSQPTLVPEKGAKDEKNAVTSFSVGGRTLMFAVMPMPVPQSEIDEAAQVSWLWPDAAKEVKAQKAHAIVTGVPGGKAVEEALEVTRLLAAAAQASDCAGVYWGNGGMVHKPAFFIDGIKSFDGEESLPGMLWVGLIVSGRSATGPFTLTTRGLNAFGHKELEIIDTKMGIGDLRMMAYGLIDYLLMRGPVLKHGNTFGGSATEKYRVEHTTSKFRNGEAVVRLRVP